MIHIPRCYTVLAWVFCFLIGVFTGLVAFGISLGVSGIFQARGAFVFRMVADPTCTKGNVLFIVFNLVCALVAGALVLVVSPAAAGSGIPNVYAYLNGVEVPDFLAIRTAVAKIPGSILTVAGSLTIGKEGPLLHIGAIIATFLGRIPLFRRLRGSKEKEPFTIEEHTRDMVACGAAAGLAAGFKAPLGGVLFAMELSSRLRNDLPFRCFFTSAVTAVVVQLCIAKCKDDCGILSWGSLLFFRVSFATPLTQVPFVALLGALGGGIGCLFTSLNMRVGSQRWRIKNKPWIRIQEVVVLSVTTSLLILNLPRLGACLECEESDAQCPPGSSEFKGFAMYGCKSTEYNDMALLLYDSQGFVLQALFTSKSGTFTAKSLVLFSLFYFTMSCLTYGAALPAGLFTPSLMVGSAFGRLFGTLLAWGGLIPDTDVSLYAFLGSATVFCGMFRFPISICVILLELTDTEPQLPLLMIAIVVAKGTGDRFNHSILNHLCVVLGLPHVGGHPESTIRRKGFTAANVMDPRVRSLNIVERVSAIQDILHAKSTSSYPVVRWSEECLMRPHPAGNAANGNGTVRNRYTRASHFVGLVDSTDLRALLDARDPEADTVDLSTIVQHPPIIIPPNLPLQTVFRIKNATGLEYLPVVECHGPLEGMVSRDELVDFQNEIIDPRHIEQFADERCKASVLRRQMSHSSVFGAVRHDSIQDSLLGEYDPHLGDSP